MGGEIFGLNAVLTLCEINLQSILPGPAEAKEKWSSQGRTGLDQGRGVFSGYLVLHGKSRDLKIWAPLNS